MKYQSNISQEIQRLVVKLEKAKQEVTSSIIREVATTLHASNLRRIHNDGEDVKENQLLGGSYSSRPMLVGAKSFPTKAAAGKIFGSKTSRKNQKWRTIKKGARSYNLVLLDGGYKELRRLSGRSVSPNFVFTGKLSKEFGIEKQNQDYVLGFTTKDAAKKARHLEKKNGGDVWGISSEDEETIGNILTKSIEDIIG